MLEYSPKLVALALDHEVGDSRVNEQVRPEYSRPKKVSMVGMTDGGRSLPKGSWSGVGESPAPSFELERLAEFVVPLPIAHGQVVADVILSDKYGIDEELPEDMPRWEAYGEARLRWCLAPHKSL